MVAALTDAVRQQVALEYVAADHPIVEIDSRAAVTAGSHCPVDVSSAQPLFEQFIHENDL
eukprot:COSAG06_NODE_64196_length_260_cov_0.639752_1_plen_59_part_01